MTKHKNAEEISVESAGLSRLFLFSLWDRSDVFLRELVQNAGDAHAHEVQLILFTEKDDSDHVHAIACVDDGVGMSEATIRGKFLRLCSTDKTSSRTYGRFGIGVFTYYPVSSSVRVLTATDDENWEFEVNIPSTVNSLADLSVGTLHKGSRDRRGTTVFLVLKEHMPVIDTLRALDYWIRGPLPCEITVGRACPPPCDLVGLKPSVVDQRRPRRVAASAPEVEGPLWNAQIEMDITGRSHVQLCEGGILVEESCSDIVPAPLRAVNFKGTVDVQPGVLTLGPGRNKVHHATGAFLVCREACESYFYEALHAGFASQGVSITEARGRNDNLFADVLESIAQADKAKAVAFLAALAETTNFEMLCAGNAKKTAVPLSRCPPPGESEVFCLDGESWGYFHTIGTVSNYHLQLHAGRRQMAETLASRGKAVFILPRLGAGQDTPLLSKEILRTYFHQRGVELHDVETSIDKEVTRRDFTPLWRNALNLPSNYRWGRLPDNMPVLIDRKNMYPTFDLDWVAGGQLRQLMETPITLQPMESRLIEAYLLFLGFRYDDGLKLLEKEIVKLKEAKVMSSTKAMARVEQAASEAVTSNLQAGNWAEDQVVGVFLQKVPKVFEFDDEGDYPISVRMTARKLRGKAEYRRGDIGVLVRIRFRDGLTVEGAAFLEAKRAYDGADTFREIRPMQLLRIQWYCKAAKLLLWNKDPVVVSTAIQDPRTTFGVSVPMAPVIEVNVKQGRSDETLFRFGIPVSHQFVLRYCRGEDLDYSAEAFSAIGGNPPTSDSPEFIVSLAVSRDGGDPPDPPEPNRDSYGELGESHPQ